MWLAHRGVDQKRPHRWISLLQCVQAALTVTKWLVFAWRLRKHTTFDWIRSILLDAASETTRWQADPLLTSLSLLLSLDSDRFLWASCVPFCLKIKDNWVCVITPFLKMTSSYLTTMLKKKCRKQPRIGCVLFFLFFSGLGRSNVVFAG